jgi:ABC-type transporter Mla subunit MlaD
MIRSRKLQLAVGFVMELLFLGLIVGLVLLGNRTLTRGFTILVDFDRVENLKEGALVRISAQPIGRVLSIRQSVRPGELPLQARLRADLWIEKRMSHFVRQNSVFYVNAKAVVGERYLEVGPFQGDPRPAVQGGELFRGIDAPLTDRLLQLGYRNVRETMSVVHALAPDLDELTTALGQLRKHLQETTSWDQVTRVYSGADRLVSEATALWSDLEAGTDRLRLVRRVATEVSAVAERKGDRLAVLERRLENLSQSLEGIYELFSPKERARVQRSLGDLGRSADQVAAMAAAVRGLVELVESGRGTIGHFLFDPELTDEVKEAHRLLKESPWRALAKPPRDQAPRGQAPRRGGGE